MDELGAPKGIDQQLTRDYLAGRDFWDEEARESRLGLKRLAQERLAIISSSDFERPVFARHETIMQGARKAMIVYDYTLEEISDVWDHEAEAIAFDAIAQDLLVNYLLDGEGEPSQEHLEHYANNNHLLNPADYIPVSGSWGALLVWLKKNITESREASGRPLGIELPRYSREQNVNLIHLFALEFGVGSIVRLPTRIVFKNRRVDIRDVRALVNVHSPAFGTEEFDTLVYLPIELCEELGWDALRVREEI